MKNHITFEDYEHVLEDEAMMTAGTKRIQSTNHELYTKRVTKIIAQPFDCKRYYLDKYFSVPFGYNPVDE